MNVLRLYCPLAESPLRCEWILLRDKGMPLTGRSALKDLPKGADRVQVVLPAADILLTQVKLPATARRTTGSLLAFAVEEKTINDPEANQVAWLGKAGDNDLLAVIDKARLERWRNALEDAGIRRFHIHAESLMLPRRAGEWSLAWTGSEGFVRHGDLESAVTDAGDGASPPVVLSMMIDRARAAGQVPGAIALYLAEGIASPEVHAWEATLQVPVRPAGAWTWKNAGTDAGKAIAHETPGWFGLGLILPRLRTAAWIAAFALVLHGVALVVDWAMLASEQRSLRQQMDRRFRSVFPDAVAVVDPLLQMRRKLTEARHHAGKPDSGDFLPMIGKVAAGVKDMQAGAVRVLSYDSGRLTLEASPLDAAFHQRLIEQLRQDGFTAEGSAAAGKGTITVRTP